jgi:hypothetical protein
MQRVTSRQKVTPCSRCSTQPSAPSSSSARLSRVPAAQPSAPLPPHAGCLLTTTPATRGGGSSAQRGHARNHCAATSAHQALGSCQTKCRRRAAGLQGQGQPPSSAARDSSPGGTVARRQSLSGRHLTPVLATGRCLASRAALSAPVTAAHTSWPIPAQASSAMASAGISARSPSFSHLRGSCASSAATRCSCRPRCCSSASTASCSATAGGLAAARALLPSCS